MADFLRTFFNLMLFTLEIVIAVALCTLSLDKKPNFIRKSIMFGFICLFTGVVFATLISLFYSTEQDYWLTAYYMCICLLSFLWAMQSFNVCFSQEGFYLTTALTTRYLSVKVAQTFTHVLSNVTPIANYEVFGYLLRALFAVLFYCVVYFLILRNKNFGQLEGKTNVYIFFLFLFMTAVLELVEIFIKDFENTYLIILNFCEAFYGFIMLFIMYSMMRQEQSEAELSVVKQLWNEDKKHYELQKENIEIINIKCHDLRHQIHNVRQNGKLTDQAMSEIEDSIYIYDSAIETNNEVLNVVLSNMMLRCHKNSIQLTCMADAGKLGFMDETDIYSLFGNMLENAMEYEMTIEEEEDRFISLTVKTVGEMVRIHTENYFISNTDVKDSVIETTKQDKNYHGFGMKSMKRIAEKYGGSFDWHIADDMFQVDVLLPIPEEARGD